MADDLKRMLSSATINYLNSSKRTAQDKLFSTLEDFTRADPNKKRLVVIGCEPHARLVAAASRALRCRSPSPRAFTRGTPAPAQEHHLLDAVHHCEDRDDVRGGREQAVVV